MESFFFIYARQYIFYYKHDTGVKVNIQISKNKDRIKILQNVSNEEN